MHLKSPYKLILELDQFVQLNGSKKINLSLFSLVQVPHCTNALALVHFKLYITLTFVFDLHVLDNLTLESQIPGILVSGDRKIQQFRLCLITWKMI